MQSRLILTIFINQVFLLKRMFWFLKKTLGKALGKFKKDIEKEAEIVEEEQEIKEENESETKKSAAKKTHEPPKPKKEEKVANKEESQKEKGAKQEVKEEKPEHKPEAKTEKEPKKEVIEETKEEAEKEAENLAEREETQQEKEEVAYEQEEEEPKKKKGFFGFLTEKVIKLRLSSEKFEKIFWELEVVLLENNVAVEVIEKIKDDLKAELTKESVSRKKVEQLIARTLKRSISELFEVEEFDLIKIAKSKKPFVIALIGVNGSGKTTTLAKLINLFQKNKMSVVVAASDTFRAAAIQQLEEHTQNLGVRLVKSGYKSDPAAVAFDAIDHAKAKSIDVVLIDTAGRLHSNTNLMDELKKVIRVSKPDLKIFVGESITGNDCVEQAKVFDELVGIDAIILSKADVDEKGGAAISVSYVTKKPILYLGIGQGYDDLKKFDSEAVINSLGI